MPYAILASEIFGLPVSIDGAQERLRDLGIVRAGATWRVAGVRTKTRDAAFTQWTPEGLIATASSPGVLAAAWLREALFDRQIVDLDGRCVTRIGDVVLEGDGGLLEVTAVEVGAAAVLRRLGLARLAARVEPQLLPIERLHFPGAAAESLLLDAPREQLESLDAATVADLLARLPVEVAEHAVQRSRHRDAVARMAQLRRSRRRNPRSPR